MSGRGHADGKYGDMTTEATHLVGKSEAYSHGYHHGRRIQGVNNGALTMAVLWGGEYIDGFLTGWAVRQYGAGILRANPAPAGLSDRWLHEADWRARHDKTRAYKDDSRNIIKKLVAEVRRLKGL